MGRRHAQANPGAVLAALEETERQVIARWERDLGLPPHAWAAVPAFRNLLELVAITRLADAIRTIDPETSESGAFFMAAERLGLEDESDLATHPAATPARRLRDWLRRAWGSGGNLRPSASVPS